MRENRTSGSVSGQLGTWLFYDDGKKKFCMDFEKYCWHDNPIHGFRIIEMEHGTGNLELDIDYIVEWICKEDSSCDFKIAPATLTFKGITELEITLDYKACTAAISPPSIHEIKRESFSYPNGYKSYSWHIVINWPTDAYIKFMADGFTQKLNKEPIIYHQQVLPHELRA